MNFLWVHFLETLDDSLRAHLQSLLSPNVKLSVGQMIPSPERMRILMAGRPKREQLDCCVNLETLVIPFAGVPPETRRLLLDFPQIAVHNLHFNAAATAEVAIALLLATAKQIIPMDRALRNHDWTPRYQPNPSILLEGKNALVLGFGEIGRRVGRICKAMGMRVVGMKRHEEYGELNEDIEVRSMKALKELLPSTQVLIICVPLTPETENLIDHEALSLLPQDAIVVNVSRGPVIHEEALYRALRDGRIYAAGLDVWYNYPKDEESRTRTAPSRFPFHAMDNVVLSPHRAGGAFQLEYRRMEALAELLNAAAQGQPIPNRVDLMLGY
jgi:phosphoglycerate dehydrogenase-like enzyme